MAVNVQIRPNGKAQLRVTHKLLPRPFFFTFETKAEAQAYGSQLHAMLDRGVVPVELMTPAEKTARDNPTVVELIRAYTKGHPITASDSDLLDTVINEVVGVRLSQLTHRWADQYVTDCKRQRNLAPGTIRKRVGVLARVLDWHLRTHELSLANPFRLLPRGYSIYSAEDIKHKPAKTDVSRDRRMSPDEAARIEAALAGEKRDDRERPWGPDPEFEVLYKLIVNQGLRLKEAVVVQVSDLDFAAGVIRVRGSKGHRGQEKPRTMAMAPAVRDVLKRHAAGRVGLLFGFWDGDPDRLRRVCGNLSARFRTLFEYSGVRDFREHDLRHEATCRWVTMRDKHGRWAFSELEICRMMGWSDPKMMLRYMSLRGEDLAARLA